MSLIIGRHQLALFCELGDGDLVDPYFPGAYARPDGVYGTSGSYVGFGNYPATTPDNICRIIRKPPLSSLGGFYGRIKTGPSGFTGTATASIGFPPVADPASPINFNEVVPPPFGPYTEIWPRWEGETSWDFSQFPATVAFTPQGIPAGSSIFNFQPGAMLINTASFGVSFDTGVLNNDAAFGGSCTFEQEAVFMVLAESPSGVCCWNDGMTFELNLDVWQIDFTATARTTTPYLFDITLGSQSFHSTLTHTVTVDSSWADPLNPYNRVHDFTIPKVTGKFTFVNDFYISSVTAP
jgi:hypothetical protein